MPRGVHQQDGANCHTNRRHPELEMPAGRHFVTWGLPNIRCDTARDAEPRLEKSADARPNSVRTPTGEQFHLTVGRSDPTSSRTDEFYEPSARNSANLVIQEFPISTLRPGKIIRLRPYRFKLRSPWPLLGGLGSHFGSFDRPCSPFTPVRKLTTWH